MKEIETTSIERVTHVTLQKLGDLVPPDDPRRRIVENLDAIAQMAIDHVEYYEGEPYPKPELQTAIKAHMAQAALLVPEFDKAKARAPVEQNSIVQAIRATVLEAERLRLNGGSKPAGGSK